MVPVKRSVAKSPAIARAIVQAHVAMACAAMACVTGLVAKPFAIVAIVQEPAAWVIAAITSAMPHAANPPTIVNSIAVVPTGTAAMACVTSANTTTALACKNVDSAREIPSGLTL